MRRAALCLVVLAPLWAQEEQTPSVDVTVQSVEGEVDLLPAAGGAWTKIEQGAKVPIGARVCTGAGGKAVLAFGTFAVAMVGENTLFRVDQCALSGGTLVVRVFIDPGLATASVRSTPRFTTDVRVSTPRITCSVKGSGMRVIANGDEIPDQALCVDDEATAQKLRLWLQILEVWERIDERRTPHRDLSASEHQGRICPFPGDPNGEPYAIDGGRLDADQIAVLAESADVLYSDLTRDMSNLRGLFETGHCSAAQVAQDQQTLLAENLGFVVQFLRTGDPSLLSVAQADLDSFHADLRGDPTLRPVDDAAHRLEHCSRYGGQLRDDTR